MTDMFGGRFTLQWEW